MSRWGRAVAAAVFAVTSTVAIVAVSVATAPTASAAAPLNCLNTIYVTSSAGTIRQVDLTSRTLVAGEPYQALPTGAGTTPNQIGVGAGGAIAIHGTSTSIVRHTRATDQTTVVAKPAGVGSGTVGAINPSNGLYYYGAYTGATLNLYVYNPATTTSTPDIVAAVTVNNPPGANGDIAFDESGRLYLVAGDGATPFAAALYRMNGVIPTTPGSPTATFTSTELTRGNNIGGTNGIAFASDGYLYISTGTSIRQLNPITGATVGTDISLPGAGITDLGTCAGPSTVTVDTDFPNGPVKPTDGFTPVLTGGGQPNPVPGTTNGETDPTIVLPGQPVTIDQTPTTGTVPGQYVTEYRCTTPDGTVVSAGSGTPGAVTPPVGTDGNSITCVITNDLPVPSLSVDKTVSPASFSAAGQVLTYTIVARNTGNTTLDNVTVTDPMTGLSAISCTPAKGSSLLGSRPAPATTPPGPVQPRLPGQTITCTATYTVTAADVAAGVAKTNTATVTGTPPTGQGVAATATDGASAGFQALPPVAVDDTANTPFRTTVVLPGSRNDTAGNGTILHGQTVFTSGAAGNGGKTLVTNDGDWIIDGNGQIAFVPGPTFVGTTAAIEYRITDSNGQTDTGTVQVTVRPGPTAAPNTATTPQDQSVTLPALQGDAPGQNANGTPGTLLPGSVVFPAAGQPANAVISNNGRTILVPLQGSYTIDPATGAVTFDPLPTFIGTASDVRYAVSDSLGNTATSYVRVTVAAVDPVANDDAANTPFATPVVLPAGTDDTPGPGGLIDQSLTVLTAPGATAGGKTLVTADGTWQVLPNGTVEFTPDDDFAGTTGPVEYRITDVNGQTDTANLTVTVRTGPSAVNDTATTPQNTDVSFLILDDDVPGLLAGGGAGSFDPDSVRFVVTPGLPAGSTVSADGRTLTVPGEGVYTFDPASEEVTFDPAPAFTGTTTPVTYEVVDQADNPARATITVDVDPVTPTAVDDAAKTPAGQPVTIDVADNDQPGAPGVDLDPTTVLLTSPDATAGGTVLVVTGEGRWEVQPDGQVTFTPEAGFTGPTAPVEYSIADDNGTRTTAEITVVVGQAPLAGPDGATTPQNVNVTVDVLANDVAGDQGNPCDPATPGQPAGCDTGTLDPDSLVFPAAGQPASATVSPDGSLVTVADVGTFTIVAGEVVFDPAPGFTGPTPAIAYEVTDSYGGTATGSIVVTVTPLRPVATDDDAATPFGAPVQLEGSTNDTDGAPTAPIQDALTRFPDAGNPTGATISPDRKTISVPDEGVYVIATDGTVTFTPEDGFTGTTTPVTYRIEDANGTTADATLVVTVRPGPTAEPNVATTLQGTPVTVAPLTDDTPSRNADDTAGDWIEALTVFPTAGQPGDAVVSADGRTLELPGEGTYVLGVDGVVTFTPEPLFSGEATPVVYSGTDSHGNSASSTITITVVRVQPTALNDEASTPFATPVTFDFATNDVPGDPTLPIDPASGTFEPADLPADSDWVIGAGGKTLTVPGEGVWTLNDDGTATFAPEDDFSGPTTQVLYTVRDVNGEPSTAGLSVLVQPGPTADDDTATTDQGVAVTVPVLDGDVPGPAADGTPGEWDLGSVVFPDAGQPDDAVISADGKTLTVPDEGVYAIGADGEITFEPEPGLRGPATPVTYAVTDSFGNTATGQLGVTVTGVDPAANDDTAVTPFDTAVVLEGAADDTAGAATAPIDLALTRFPDAGQPDGATISGDRKTITVDGEGQYVIGTDGRVTFTPVAGFVGTTTSVTYRIEDANGTTDDATLSVTVRPGPVATDDTGATAQGVEVSVPVLTNDEPGRDVADVDLDWDLDSMVFPADGQPDGAEVADDGKTLTVPGEGVYTIEDDGQVTFAPEPGFRGPASPVTYAIANELGSTTSATLTITVAGIDPIATDDAASTPFDTAVTLPGAANDLAGAPSAPLVPGNTVFPAAGQPDDAVVSADGRTITVPGEGAYVINGDGEITFTPEAGYTGTTTPVTYRIEDENGTTDTATVTVTVRRGPSASDDVSNTPQNVTVGVPVLENDSPGLLGNGDPGDWDLDTMVFPAAGQPEDAVVSNDGLTLTVPDEGVYTIGADGVVTFDPDPGFRGTTSPVTYTLDDTLGNAVSAELEIIVTGIDPVATDDTEATPFATPVTFEGARNDEPGAPSAPIVPSATVFPAAGQPTGAEVSADGKTLTVPDEGVYEVNPDGSITFTPADGFSGVATPVTYRIEDANGTSDTATLTATVRPGPTADDEAVTTPQNITVVIDVLDGDVPGLQADGEPGGWDVDSVVLTVDGQPGGVAPSADGKTLVVPGVGVYTVGADGRVTFDPVATFTGVAEPVVYAVTDSLGNTATAEIVVTVTAIVPTAVNDAAQTPFGTPVTVDLLDNDTAGADTAPLVPGSTVFVVTPGLPAGSALSDDDKTLTVPGEGVYSVDDDGVVTFTPEPGFAGTATPVTYQVEDANGTTDTATLTVTVRPAPVALPDRAATPQGLPVTLDPLANDTPGPNADGTPGAWDPTSVVFPADGQPADATVSEDGKTLVVDGVGTFVIDPTTGEITFTPEPGYTGPTPPVTYEVTDTNGNPVTGTVVVEVGAVVPTATDDRATTRPATPVTLDVLANDAAGDPDVPLDPTTLRLVDGSGALVTSLTVPGEGTWRVVDGALVFTPVRGFAGTTTPVTYSVADANGTRTTAEAVVLVTKAGEALPDNAQTGPGEPVVLDVLDNDLAAEGEELDPTSVCLLPGTAQGKVSGKVGARTGADRCIKAVTVDGVGTWEVLPDGSIRFTPAPGYAGTASIGYTVTDTGGDTYTSTATVKVTPEVTDPVDEGPDGGGTDIPDAGGFPVGWLYAGLGSLLLGLVLLTRNRLRRA